MRRSDPPSLLLRSRFGSEVARVVGSGGGFVGVAEPRRLVSELRSGMCQETGEPSINVHSLHAWCVGVLGRVEAHVELVERDWLEFAKLRDCC